jgi:MFS family permease
MTQFTGINVINYYGPTMYKLLGVTGHANFLLNAIYSIIGPVFNGIFIIFFIDRVGRKKPLVIGPIGLGVVLIIETVMNAVYEPANASGAQFNRAGQAVGIAMIWLTAVIFSMSFGPISWYLFLYLSD